jgi:hypothetical protein
MYAAFLVFLQSSEAQMLYLVLLLDWLTGTPRAVLEKRFDVRRLPLVLVKLSLYLSVLAVLQVFFGGIGLPLVDHVGSACFYLLLLKEVISVLQNVKGVSVALGWHNPMIDVVIDFLRLDVFHSVLHRLPGARASDQVADELARDDNPVV